MRFPVFGPKVFRVDRQGAARHDASTGRSSSTSRSGCASEPVERWRVRRGRAEAREVHDLLAAWAASTGDEAERVELDDDFDFLSDRGRGHLGAAAGRRRSSPATRGPHGPKRPRGLLSARGHDDEGLPVALIRDVRAVFAEEGNPEVDQVGRAGEGSSTRSRISPWGSAPRRPRALHPPPRPLLAAVRCSRPERDRDLGGDKVRGWWRSLARARLGALPRPTTKTTTTPRRRSHAGFARFPDQSVPTVSNADFPLNQADSGRTLCRLRRRRPWDSLRNRADKRSTKGRLRQLGHFEPPERAKARKRTRSARMQISRPPPRGSPQTLEIGDGPPLEAHRLPPDAGRRPTASGFGGSSPTPRRARRHARRSTARRPAPTPTTPGFAVRIWSLSDGATAWALDARDPQLDWASSAATLARWPEPARGPQHDLRRPRRGPRRSASAADAIDERAARRRASSTR